MGKHSSSSLGPFIRLGLFIGFILCIFCVIILFRLVSCRCALNDGCANACTRTYARIGFSIGLCVLFGAGNRAVAHGNHHGSESKVDDVGS